MNIKVYNMRAFASSALIKNQQKNKTEGSEWWSDQVLGGDFDL